MNPHLPVPERTLPAQSAERIRRAILHDEPEATAQRANRWMLGLAAALVVIALLATAAVLWPSAQQGQPVEPPIASPTSTPADPTPAATDPAPTGPPTPTPAPSRTGPLEPGPKQAPIRTDRGPLSAGRVRAMVAECEGPDGVGLEALLYARRITDGRKREDVAIYRRQDGQEWFCAPDSMYVPLDAYRPEIGPNESFPVITDSGQGYGMDQNGVTSVWIFRALSSVQRIQVRAVVDGKPKRWFEAEVQGGFAYVPTFTAGTFRSDRATGEPAGFTYEQRAFDKEGREVPVRVMELPR